MSDGTVVILGAGLTGLSAARSLVARGAVPVVLEAESRVGGLCRTEESDGFSFDYAGHLLHLRDDGVLAMIRDDMGVELQQHTRRASVHVEDTFVPYPIQANFGRLSVDTVRRCIEGYRRSGGAAPDGEASFPDWARGQFGDGLAEIFMIPYNRKLYVHPLEDMEPSWTARFVPRPDAEAMERAALGEEAGTYGYNATFLYPREGGIEVLPRALARGTEDRILLGKRAVSVDAARKTVAVEGGEVYPYDRLISTIPLTSLLRMTSALPDGLGAASANLRFSAVQVLCLAFDSPALRDEHWIYFPEERHPFYRVGIFTNFSRSMAPDGTSSFYVEVARLPGGREPDVKALADGVERTLKEMEILSPSARPAARLPLTIPCGYVFFDRFRRRNLGAILTALGDHSIHSVGRYGAWEYSSMEDAIEWGIRIAGEIAP